ncbi:hypothetical protein WUBG_06264 [Wuchereria bancrofti]|uniref:Uncharacterized protein n=1 Tax=Wuchereria bancrofti TaxID=6293 RepID=J9EK34_WUCBA|nr:hypothetical protein WUBG_06264 [Wuchereria bancrofti]VDM14456.1 unnamed protein product [Wuchereria bancrofti]
MLYHWWDGFNKHPTVHCLKSYLGSNGSSWRVVAESINGEYRNVLDTLSITLTGIDRVVMTSSWILYVTNYTLTCAQVSDVSLEAIRADEHPVLLVIYLSIRAESFRDLRNKLDKPIAVAREVVLKQSLNERFVEAFTQQIALNPKYDYDEPERLEPCLGCSTEMSNIKLWKRCLNDVQDDMDAEGPKLHCTQCYCRPMWCDTCMGLIFASKQDPHRPELWMPGKAQCPTCRATFCILDVAFLNIARIS